MGNSRNTIGKAKTTELNDFVISMKAESARGLHKEQEC